ncbi:MAG: tetratricopeptide repeat protein [Actinophytocola sp.]|nr:tetratricopeptide repeat protein [Actinophytocola sp.]
MPHEQFGPYRLDKLIGHGGMGEVYRAFDTVKQRPVAVKRLRRQLSVDTEFQIRFRKESELTARLREPHVVPIHDFGEIDGQLFIDMRLIEGEDLGTVLSRAGVMPPERAVRILSQVAGALDAAHAEGLVHRDVKPSNVLLAHYDFAYLVDFGIARIVTGNAATSVTATGATVGTADYMAPERFHGRSGDARADVYSLACLFYETLTGKKPYPVDGLPAMIHAHLNLDIPRPSQHPGVPVSLDAVIARGMAKEPDRRFGSAGELADAAHEAVHGQGMSGGREPASATMPAEVEAPPPSPTVPAARHRADLSAPADRTCDKVLRDLTRALERNPHDATALAYRGEVLRAKRRYSEALDDLNRAIELQPDHAWAIGTRGDIYRNVGRYADAIADYTAALALEPDTAWVLVGRGDTQRLLGEYQAAVADLTRAVELEPADERALAYRGDSYRGMHQYELAHRDFDRAIELKPTYAWAIAARGMALRSMGRYDEALADYTRAIELEPIRAWMIAGRGETSRLMGRYDDAIADLTGAIRLEPSPAVLGRRARLHCWMGRQHEAIADYTRAIELDPAYAWSYEGRADAYRQIGQFEQALTDLDSALELEPEVGWWHFRRALISLERGESARDEIKAAISTGMSEVVENPGCDQPLLALAIYRAARGEFDDAGMLIAQALSHAPKRGWILETVYELEQLLRLDDGAGAELTGLIDTLRAALTQPEN